MDLKKLTDSEFKQLFQDMYKEAERRDTVATAEEKTRKIQESYAAAIGRETGGAWTQPLGAHDAYPEGALVTYDGRLYRSDIPNNVWEPGVHGWSLNQDPETEPEPQPDAPAWESDTPYIVGDLVVYDEVVYRVLQDHTSQSHWAPPGVPALYVVA